MARTDEPPAPFNRKCSNCRVVREFGKGRVIKDQNRIRLCVQCDLNVPHPRWIMDRTERETRAEYLRQQREYEKRKREEGE